MAAGLGERKIAAKIGSARPAAPEWVRRANEAFGRSRRNGAARAALSALGAALAAALAGLRARPGLERAALRARFLTRALRTSPSGLAIVPARVGTPLN